MASSSSSNRPGKSGAKVGDEWTYQIYFDPEADQASGTGYSIEDDELLSTLARLVGVDEKILHVSAYKVPLSSMQLTQLLLYHMFVIFETKAWWWSIEKHSDGITIQRSKKSSAVKERYRQTKRFSGISLMTTDERRLSVHDLIKWLYQQNELNKPYHYLSSNCKHFATAVFDHVAKTKKL